MVFLRKVIGGLAGVYCCSRLAAGYVVANPAVLSGFDATPQQVFTKARVDVNSPINLPQGVTDQGKNTLDVLVPSGLEAWILQQRKTSMRFLLDNIAPNGVNARGAAPGSVIASPSKKAPNYYYQWVRDAAITMAEVVEEYGDTADENLKAVIEQYAKLQGILQNTFNPSGGYTTGGLGEPKFMIDGAPFTEHWGRPQRDGPALRALTLIAYVRLLNDTDPSLINSDWLRGLYDGKFPTQSVIKADLEYISNHWNHTGFDLWEEVSDRHFYTALVQHKALTEGRELAVVLNDRAAADWYDSQQRELRQFLQTSFWNQTRGHLIAFLDTRDRSGIDCGLLLASLHGGQEDLFPPWSDKILASLAVLVADMAELYPINKLSPPYYSEGRLRGVGIGRYPEDRYNGVGLGEGNPWFLCTSSVSNILYNTIERFVQQGYFEINDINRAFFARLHPTGSAVKGKYDARSAEFSDYLVDMFKYADSFMNVIRWHTTPDGRLSEQFNKYSGFQRGAKDLTWSYGSFKSAADDRVMAKRALLTKVMA